MSNSKPTHQNPLIFISHDSRDSKLAEIFRYLLQSVSNNQLRTFCSSAYHIEFGKKWYPQLIEKINEASHVVCILSQNSLNKPWILYEAGLAEAKINGTIFGVAFGVTLKKVTSSGPFSQFQNCKGTEKDLCALIKQLLMEIPNLDNPDDLIIKSAVTHYFKKMKPLIKDNDDVDISLDQLYRTIKDMSNNLHVCNIDHPKLCDFLDYSFTLNGEWGFIFVLNLLKVDYPWLYDMGFEILKERSKLEKDELTNIFSDFKNMANFSINNNIYETDASKRRDYTSILEKTMKRLYISDNKIISLI